MLSPIGCRLSSSWRAWRDPSAGLAMHAPCLRRLGMQPRLRRARAGQGVRSATAAHGTRHTRMAGRAHLATPLSMMPKYESDLTTTKRKAIESVRLYLRRDTEGRAVSESRLCTPVHSDSADAWVARRCSGGTRRVPQRSVPRAGRLGRARGRPLRTSAGSRALAALDPISSMRTRCGGLYGGRGPGGGAARAARGRGRTVRCRSPRLSAARAPLW